MHHLRADTAITHWLPVLSGPVLPRLPATRRRSDPIRRRRCRCRPPSVILVARLFTSTKSFDRHHQLQRNMSASRLVTDAIAPPPSTAAAGPFVDDRTPVTPLSSSAAAAAASASAESSLKRKGMADGEESKVDGSAAKRVKSDVTPAAGASSSSSAMSFAVWRPSTWNELTVDFIESITAFLTLKELVLTSRLCRNWTLTVDDVTPRDDAISLPHNRLLRLISSPLRRHVIALHVNHSVRTWNMITHSELKLIQFHLPNLRSVTCTIDCTVGPLDVHRDFPALTTLNVRLFVPSSPSTAVAWSHVRRAIIDITRVRTLSSLSIYIAYHSECRDVKLSPQNMPLGVLQPLVDLRHSLTSLVFSCPCIGGVWPRTHLNIIRALVNLTDLSLNDGRLSSHELNGLTFGNPIPFQLKRIDFGRTFIYDDHAAPLARLTTLTAFEPSCILLADASFIASLVQLEILRLDCTARVNVTTLLTALAHCTHIHTLYLSHPRVTDEQLTTMLSTLSHIRHFTLDGMAALTDLAFASAVSHLAVTLESLTIACCQHISSASLSHLRALHTLHRLELTKSFDGAPDAHTLAGFTPSDRDFLRDKWPHLIYFEFTP
jgi:hypothetical protein